ncbi:DUF5658 family protein [Bacillus kwashiorkori]|uniref:DUF5658 family protein n=1 Tax=Bacillus kwashiorkori TaxID=1522318 RepID=UPI00078222F0|nr:DUF5658 family protein [Bacillus kwashiorkori]
MKNIFRYLAGANFLDGVFTYVGLQKDAIKEGNPLMNFLYAIDPHIFLWTKILLSFLLLLFLIYDHIPTSLLIKIISFFAAVAYTVILCLHGVWIFNW